MGIILTEEQLKVVKHLPNAHGRVLAGPGTGKSTTAVALVELLLAKETPPKVRFLTFTRAATAELAKKLPPELSHNLERPSTIHSFAISVLLQNHGCASMPEPLRIPDDYEYWDLIRPHLARQVRVPVGKFDDLIAEMSAMWQSLNPEERSSITSEERARFMGGWNVHRRVFGYTLLQELPDLLRQALLNYDSLKGIDYDTLIVDEYQDLNACDLAVLKLLSNRAAFILAIGDDDQSIYSFRKAHPQGIRNFLEDYKTQNDYKLTVCQRSPQRIIEWAQYVIQGDGGRESRNPPTFRSDAPEGMVALLNFRRDKSEAKGVADIIAWLHDTKSVPWSEILVLSRTDRSGTFTRFIKEELKNRETPIADAAVIDNILADSGNRWLLSLIRLLVYPTDSLAWWTLLKLTDGIGSRFIDYIYEFARSSNLTFGQALTTAASGQFKEGPRLSSSRAISVWNEVLNSLSTVKLPDDKSGAKWGKWIIDEIERGRLPNISDEFKQLLLDVDNIVEKDVTLGRFLSQIQPLGEEVLKTKNNGVRFMTMMGSKGLTVRSTIVIGVEDDLLPRPDQDLDEERRLLYVAMTRSQEFLFLTWANRRQGPAARSGRINTGRRRPSDFLRGSPVESQDGEAFIRALG